MKCCFVLALLLVCKCSSAQHFPAGDSSHLIRQNQLIDDYVVTQNVAELRKLYADDFVFSHGSGRVDNKQSWLGSVEKGRLSETCHDSTTVELHGLVAILRGKLQVQKKTKSGINKYHLYYVRVFSKQSGQWQMISHLTTSEFHELAAK